MVYLLLFMKLRKEHLLFCSSERSIYYVVAQKGAFFMMKLRKEQLFTVYYNWLKLIRIKSDFYRSLDMLSEREMQALRCLAFI
jgi:hypothetical protein